MKCQPFSGTCVAAALAGTLASVSACSKSEQPRASADRIAAVDAEEQTAIGQLPDVDVNAVLAHTRALSSDEFEGRAPGTRGEERTVTYLIDQFRKAGLRPGNTNGSYTQKVPLVGITPAPAPLVLKHGGSQDTLQWRDEVVAWTRHEAPTAALEDSELVFVGYGIVAPEFQWDDYKGVDVKGKTLVMLVNDPPVPDASDPTELDSTTFGGKATTSYGRWTYKFEIGAEKGAAGVIVVHDTDAAGYPFQVVQESFEGERFNLASPDKNMSRPSIEAWVSGDAARRLLQMAGQDLDKLKQEAATREFKPVPLGVTATMVLHNKLRTVDSENIVGRIQGSDPVRRSEYVVYTAHWDQFGKRPEGVFHGAEDDALGCASLVEIARAFSKLPAPPRRSILFIALTSQEQGLLGSEYYTSSPIYPLAKTVADINLDSWNVSGRTTDLVLIGLGASELDEYVRDAAAEQGRVVHGDPEPEKGSYYRSDHFNFAKQGVPAIEPSGGTQYVGKPADFAQKVREEWTNRRYRSPSDVVLPTWDLSGMREDLKVYFAVGYRVAESDRFPEWAPGNEFKAKRDAMLRQ